MITRFNLLAVLLLLTGISSAADGNRLSYLEENNPWYPHTDFPKLVTPQWVGEEGVEAVVVLAIDDMRETPKYESYLRPILQRLKQIDGRAPVSIMTCKANPDDPQLQAWLEEGVSIEVHTYDHPCPLLQGGDFSKAKSTYDRCVDLLNQIPGNKPVAYRMPCCDSLNTVSPRFYSDIFSRTTEQGNFLSISSSVFNVFTSADKDIPRELVLDGQGNERFRKYFPKGLKRQDLEHNNFLNWIENYPYPYVINGSCWEFPCITPSDWEAQFLQQPNNPATVEDMKTALDITVLKNGVFNLVFHPHGWIEAGQIVELIDHAVQKHGNKVKFLTFREALDRINRNLLDGESLRAGEGGDHGVRLLDINNDGFQDVVMGTPTRRVTRIWRPRSRSWADTGFPVRIGQGVQFTLVREDSTVSVLSPTFEGPSPTPSVISARAPEHAWYFDGREWRGDDFLQNLVRFSRQVRFSPIERDDAAGPVVSPAARSWKFQDIDHDGRCEAIVTWQPVNKDESLRQPKRADVNVFRADFVHPPRGSPPEQQPFLTWRRLKFAWPAASLAPQAGINPALFRFRDFDGDGLDDLIASTDSGSTVALFDDFNSGWQRTVLNVDREHEKALPVISPSDGSDNGFFTHSGNLCWQNENTDGLTDLVRRVPVDDLLAGRRAFESAGTSQKKGVLVGAATIDITPDYPIRLSGYGSRKTESEGVAQRIHAKALVIGGDEEFLPDTARRKFVADQVRSELELTEPELSVILTVDTCGVPASVTEKIFDILQKRWRLKRERFVVCSSHSHSAPWLRDFAPNLFAEVPEEHLERLARYEQELITKATAVVHEAIARRRLGSLEWGKGKVTFARNRRLMVDGRWAGFGDVPDGPVDHQLPVLAAFDIHDKPIAVLANYACHCTTETGKFNQISGDWATAAGDFIEEELDAGVALISIGAGADANPSPRGTHEQAIRHGRTLADEVLRLLKTRGSRYEADGAGFVPGSLTPIDPRAICRLARIDLPLGPLPTREHFENELTAGGVRESLARQFLDMLDRGESLPTVVPDYPVATWTFGKDLAMVFLAGEVVVDYGIRMSDQFDGDRLWLSAYSNAMPCYIASKRILREGGYEADSSMRYYARPTRLAPETEDLIVDTVQKLLPPEFYSKETQRDFPPPKSPEESAAAIQLRPGLKVEIAAAEPLIHDPVAFDWDIEGRLYVVEMGDYPDGPVSGRVRLLEDSDKDGRYDTAKTFLDNIPFPTGIHRWRDGVLVCAAPEIFYAEDSDGDGKADVRKTLYRGFGEGNQQHRVNGLRWGLDNWLHLANGDSGGSIEAISGIRSEPTDPTSKATHTDWLDTMAEVAGPGQSVAINGRDLRICPDDGTLQPLSGQTQFGRERDDWGNWFGNNNSNPIWHYALDDRYLRRNPQASVSIVKSTIAEVPGAAPVFPVSRTLARFNDFGKANRFTSACSTAIYRDHLLGENFYGNAFTCEPVHNLISRHVLEQSGTTFKARRADDEADSEFLASSDNWFRPVMIRTGPDGALWVADMYRFVIEHPKWIPQGHQRKLDLRAGSNRGRIYRIVPDSQQACCGRPAATPSSEPVAEQPGKDSARTWLHQKWDRVAPERLVQRLGSPNGWWRDTIQRIILHRHDCEGCDQIERMSFDHPSPQVRIQAMYTLRGLLRLSLARWLQDPHPQVRRHAIRIAGPFIRELPDDVQRTETREAFLKLIDDPDPQVQMQLAYSLGEFPTDDEAALALGQIAVRNAANPWIAAAVLSSLNQDNVESVLAEVLNADTSQSAVAVLTARLLGQAAGFDRLERVASELVHLLPTKGRPPASWDALNTILKSAQGSRTIWQKLTSNPDLGHALSVSAESAMSRASDSNESPSTRRAAIEFLGLSSTASRGKVTTELTQFLSPDNAIDIQLAAVSTIGSSGSDSATESLLSHWLSLTPRVRLAVVDVLLQRGKSRGELLNAIDRGDVAVSDLDASRREALLTGGPAALQSRARSLFSSASSSNRREVVDQFMPALELVPSIDRGKAVFEKRCSACHKLKDIGKSIGADLTALRDRSSLALLTAILDPNRAVEAKFLSYSALTDAGRTFSGMLLSETSNSITLVGVDGKQHVLLRSQLEQLVGTNRSLMPEGLEKDLSHQDIADVIAFVQYSGSPSKRFQGNQPVTIQAATDGTVTLPATAASIFGPTLVFEPKYQNLGWWQSKDDYAVWTFELPSSGTYDVEFDYACDNSSAGNVLLLSTEGRELRGSVPGSGTWDDYRTWTPGRIDLRRGINRLTVSSPVRPQGAVIDLRTIRLSPSQ